MTSARLKILALAVIMVTVGELCGRTVNRWYKGGEGGTVNLPAAKSRLMSPGGLRPNSYRYGFRMAGASQGLAMTLPSNLPRAIATFTYGSLVVSTAICSGKVNINGAELVKLQRVGVKSFRIDLDDGFDCYLRIVVVLNNGGVATCEVLVE